MTLNMEGGRSLWNGALAVLAENDLGGWTRPAPRLYPHQWSWDSAFIAIGLAHVDPQRALTELTSLLRSQWTDGRIPHIAYNPAVPPEAYFPDAARWDCPARSPLAPNTPLTSGIIQPPVHAIALRAVLDEAGDHAAVLGAAGDVAQQLFRWHHYLALHRDPDARGLITIYHPWESGTDNSPRWDEPLGNVNVGVVPPYVRRDLAHVTDRSQRPTDAEYDRYLWLVESLKDCGYDDDEAHRRHPFLIKDVLFSAIFAVANAALAEVFDRLGKVDESVELRALESRFSQGVAQAFDEQFGLALDLDLRTGRPIRVQTWAGLAPLLPSEVDQAITDRAAERLMSADFAGNPNFDFAVVPSTTPGSAGFRAQTYWRGPSWPIANWLLWWGLRRHGHVDAADRLRTAYLAMLSQQDADFAEYFHPYSGRPLGSRRQSWTAAVVLDWLAQL